MPRWIEPMAASLARDDRLPAGTWWLERKLDGVRLLAYVAADEVRLLSRNRIRQEDVYPEVAEALGTLPLEAVIDGEVVAFEEGVARFERLQERMHIHDAARARRSPVRVSYVAFDLLWLAGRDVRALPLLSRRTLLEQLVEPDATVQVSPRLEGDVAAARARAGAEGWEGLIAKRPSSPYRGGRSRDWMKLKLIRQQEMVVVGFTEPTGARPALGALLLGYHQDGQLRYGGKVGTGFRHSVLVELRTRLEPLAVATAPVADPPREPTAHWVRPEVVVQVAFGEWSRSGRLRHPRYLGLRTDKDPGQVVREG